MPGKMSNRDRIAHMAEEAKATKKDKEAKKDKEPKSDPGAKSPAAKSPAKARAKKPPARVKIVWVVCDQTGSQVKTFPYPEESAAQTEAQQRTAATGKTHFVTRAEVPL